MPNDVQCGHEPRWARPRVSLTCVAGDHGRSSSMDERHREDIQASVQLHVHMCIDEMTRLVNRRVVLDLLEPRPPVMESLV
jgi:hypothetical protein